MSVPNYGARIRAARGLRHLSQAQLAARLDVSQACVAQWEDHGNFRPIIIPSLARALGVSEDYLRGRDDCMSAVEEFVTTPRKTAAVAKRKPLRIAEAHANRKRGKK